jgi:UDP-N-acetylglucosamine enolpyruvyl transferase
MGTFKIEGGIQPAGHAQKNEVSNFMCSTFNARKVTITNITDIIDVNKLITYWEIWVL